MLKGAVLLCEERRGEESGSGRVNLETAEDQRLAAEEYVASIAESGAPKPNWWKEFLQSVRMWIADRFPHARQIRMTDREIETLLARSARAARRNRRGEGKVIAPESMIRFRVNKNGETVFGIAGRDGDFTAREIMEDKTISENTPVLTSEGSEVWGEITPEMAEAGKELGLEALPIKLLKGKHFGNHAGFGLAHLWNQHGAELEARGYDLSDFLTGVFGKPNQIYASRQGDNIRLELVTKSKPRNVGVLELRKEDGFYSVVTAFPIDVEHYKINGKEVWRYTGSKPNKISQEGSSVISAGKQRTSPLEPLSADNAAGTARVTRPKPDINITSSGEKSSGNTGAVYSVDSVWTGSAASYDAPSLQYIGTGEGAQVYGWGLYGSSSRKVGEWYAKEDVKRKNRERILLDGKEPDLDRMDKLERNVLLDVLGRKGSISGTLEYYRLDLNKPRNPHFYDDSEEIRAQAKWLENNKDRIEYIPENQNSSGRRNLYRQTFWPGKEENLLDWDNNISPEQAKTVLDALHREYDDFDSPTGTDLISRLNMAIPSDISDAEAVMLEIAPGKREARPFSGEEAYQALSEFLGSPKAASEFLYRAGIDGVTFVGNSSGVRNYVAFSDQDIRVDEHLRFAISEFSADEESDIIALLRPFIGVYMSKSDAEIVDYLRRHGVELSEEEAHAFHKLATDENRAEARKRSAKQRNDWLYENVPVWQQTVDAAGSENFKIVPSMRFRDEIRRKKSVCRGVGKNRWGLIVGPHVSQWFSGERPLRIDLKRRRGKSRLPKLRQPESQAGTLPALRRWKLM